MSTPLTINPPLRLVFLGSDPIALPLLGLLADGGRDLARVVAIYTQPDRPAGRGQRLRPNAVKQWGLAHGLPVRQPVRLREADRIQLAADRADFALVMAYGQILREEFIAAPRFGTLNLHTSLLPKYRGASPIPTAIACGERKTGVTLMRIVRRVDAGPVAGHETVEIGELDTAAAVTAKLAAACVPLLGRSLPLLALGRLEFSPQDEAAATWCRKLRKEDGQLDFSAPAAALAARINGLFPWPACRFELNGEPIKVGLADVPAPSVSAGYQAGVMGEVLGADPAGLLVATGSGPLRLRRLQRAGGKMLAAAAFLRGYPIATSVRLISHPMPPLPVESR